MKENRVRDERLQIMLSPEELVAVDDFRFKKRMPSRAAAVRELLRRGLAADAISDPSYLSCAANDFGYEQVFSRQNR
jgi:phosphoheptose isomerase